jgi:hydroxyacylglutathione hydrolase
MHHSPAPTGQIDEHLYAVRVGLVNFFVLVGPTNTICIDSGVKKEKVQWELEQLRIEPDRVTDVFLTHSDYDHTGGLEVFRNARVFLPKDEEQMINGKTARAFWLMRNKRLRCSYKLLEDGAVQDLGDFKVRAIATPGHTPGSMSYLVNETLLFTGDTLSLHKGQIHPFSRLMNMDTATQKHSITKLAALQGVKLLCTGHTGYTFNFDAAAKAWLKTQQSKYSDPT